MARKDPAQRDLITALQRLQQSAAANAALLDKLNDKIKEKDDGGHRTDPAQDRAGADTGDGAGGRTQPAADQGARAGGGFVSSGGLISGPIFDPRMVQTWTASPNWTYSGSVLACGDPSCQICSARQTPPSPPPQPYSGQFEFAVGEIYAIRRWRLSADGRLLSVGLTNSIIPPWRAGVNEAECFASRLFTVPLLTVVDPSGQGRHARSASVVRGFAVEVTWDTGDIDVYMPSKLELRPMPEHDTPDEFCTCGFYAFSDPRHLINYSAEVVGIVKITGRVLVGAKGYRGQKAEIVAVHHEQGSRLFHHIVNPEPDARMELFKLNYPGVAVLNSLPALLEYAPLTQPEPPQTDASSPAAV